MPLPLPRQIHGFSQLDLTPAGFTPSPCSVAWRVSHLQGQFQQPCVAKYPIRGHVIVVGANNDRTTYVRNPLLRVFLVERILSSHFDIAL